MDRWMFVFYILNALFIKAYISVQIKDISVPSMVIIDGNDNDNVRNIVLDCEYELMQDDNNLVLKWYKDNEVMYQWIRGQSPSVFPQFRNEIDVEYRSSNNIDTMFSSISLVNPNIDTTGNYKCVIQTIRDTDAMEKRLQVIDISNYTLLLFHHRVQNETQLECTVDNVYPKPTLVLNTIDDDEEVVLISERVHENENGLFNATTIAVIGDDDDDADAYICTVMFAKMPLNLTTTAVSSANHLWEHLQHILILVATSVFVVVANGT